MNGQSEKELIFISFGSVHTRPQRQNLARGIHTTHTQHTYLYEEGHILLKKSQYFLHTQGWIKYGARSEKRQEATNKKSANDTTGYITAVVVTFGDTSGYFSTPTTLHQRKIFPRKKIQITMDFAFKYCNPAHRLFPLETYNGSPPRQQKEKLAVAAAAGLSASAAVPIDKRRTVFSVSTILLRHSVALFSWYF